MFFTASRQFFEKVFYNDVICRGAFAIMFNKENNMKQKEQIAQWDGETRLAAVYALYLALDNEQKQDRDRQFEKLFDIRQNIVWYLNVMGLMEPGEKLPEDSGALDAAVAARLKRPDTLENYSLAFSGFGRKKIGAIRFVDGVIDEGGDDRHERLAESIDLLLGANPCGAASYAARKCLWVFVMFSVGERILSDRKRKFLRHFCRVAELDASLLPEMETAAKLLVDLGKQRMEAKSSDANYAGVLKTLAELDAGEQALQDRVLALLGKSENESAFEDDDDAAGEFEEESFLDKAGNAVVDVIEGVTDGVVSVIDGFSNAIWDLM
jgi:hypothetical protein